MLILSLRSFISRKVTVVTRVVATIDPSSLKVHGSWLMVHGKTWALNEL